MGRTTEPRRRRKDTDASDDEGTADPNFEEIWEAAREVAQEEGVSLSDLSQSLTLSDLSDSTVTDRVLEEADHALRSTKAWRKSPSLRRSCSGVGSGELGGGAVRKKLDMGDEEEVLGTSKKDTKGTETGARHGRTRDSTAPTVAARDASATGSPPISRPSRPSHHRPSPSSGSNWLLTLSAPVLLAIVAWVTVSAVAATCIICGAVATLASFVHTGGTFSSLESANGGSGMRSEAIQTGAAGTGNGTGVETQKLQKSQYTTRQKGQKKGGETNDTTSTNYSALVFNATTTDAIHETELAAITDKADARHAQLQASIASPRRWEQRGRTLCNSLDVTCRLPVGVKGGEGGGEGGEGGGPGQLVAAARLICNGFVEADAEHVDDAAMEQLLDEIRRALANSIKLPQ
jgi:hypothetical protein